MNTEHGTCAECGYDYCTILELIKAEGEEDPDTFYCAYFYKRSEEEKEDV